MPVDCTRVGTAAVSLSHEKCVLAAASATVVVAAPEVRFPQGNDDYCVAYSCASAVHHAGDSDAASVIASLALESTQQSATNRIKWMQMQLRGRLQPAWQPRRIKNAQQLDKTSLLAQLQSTREKDGRTRV